MPRKLWISSFFTCLFTFALALPASAAPRSKTRASDDDLTLAFAHARKAQISAVDYQLHLKFEKGSERFSGKLVALLGLARTDKPLSFDFLDGNIKSIKVNETPVADFVTRTGSLDIPARYLAKSSRVEIEYEAGFNKDGRGVMRSVDPEDGAEYIFTDFEPYDAHRMFPCFDQPDLKATYEITLTMPRDWKAISNELTQDTSAQDGVTTTKFKKTPPFSTYLVFVGAGPFIEWKDKAGDVPTFIYARKSLAKYVDHARLFDITKKGMAFFNEFFGYKYPFSKYGLVFIPEFMSGGMENIGAVTLNERFIFRGPVTHNAMDGRDNLLLHEMAHLWFGDLVTMKWWNDLWLNESFATYMAALSQDRAAGAKTHAWLDFFSDKSWAYWQDQIVTTHPIETHVPDVRTSKGNFDGITYAKGAAALKQLHFYVGEEAFRQGVRAYFKEFAFKNAERADFVDAIAKASKHDLGSWTKAWLRSAGPHRVRPKWTCKGGTISSFTLEQEPNTHGVLSPHRTRIGLYKKDDKGRFQSFKAVDTSYSKRRNLIAELKGAPCPDFVYPNVDDMDYALFSLDPVSLGAAKSILAGGVEDPLVRLMVWGALAQMVRDTELSVTDYMEMALAGIEAETNENLLGILLNRNSTPRGFFYGYLSRARRKEIAPRFESMIWKRLETAAPGSNLQMVFWDYYVSIAYTPDANARIYAALRGEKLPKGLKFDQDRRWNVISKLAANGSSGAAEMIAAEEKVDQSTMGKRAAFSARAALPQQESKARFWGQLDKPGEVPFSSLRAAAGQFHHSDHLSLTAMYREPFFARVTSMDWKKNDEMIGIFFESLFPSNLCAAELLTESKAKLASAKRLTPLAKRAWLEANEELSKCISVRKRAGYTDEKT